MDQRTIPVLFALLRSAISGTKQTEEKQKLYTSELLEDLLRIADKSDISHLLVFGLKQNGLITKENANVEKHVFKAVYRYERLRREYERLCIALERAQIPFLPLKGSVIRALYPEPWMRTSCDIDILVRQEDTEKAKDLLINTCGYTFQEIGPHDISLFSPSNIHIELHYDLIEKGTANEAASILRSIWRVAQVKDGFAYWYEMPDEVYYFYHIAHMAKHFEIGGCGIRPFIDLWILDNRQEVDQSKRDNLLDRGGLLKFAEAARKLSRIWFEEAEYDSLSRQMEEYLLLSGLYGSNANRVAVQQQKKGGRLRYALSRIFLPYDIIKFHYPVLQKHRWLIPVMEVYRWCKLLFCGHLKRAARELRYNSHISDEKAKSIREFLENIGL